MGVRIKLRRDTSTNWQSVNPVLDEGELGYETDTGRFKIGDGVTDWNNLPYVVGERVPKGFDFNNVTDKVNIDNVTIVNDSGKLKVKDGVFAPSTHTHKLEDLTDIPTPQPGRFLRRKEDDTGYEWVDVTSSGSGGSSQVIQYEFTVTSGETRVINLPYADSCNKSFVTVLKEVSFPAEDLHPCNFDDSEWNYNNVSAKIDDGVMLNYLDRRNTVAENFYYKVQINVDDYKEIVRIMP
jgi:hypothetical protein